MAETFGPDRHGFRSPHTEGGTMELQLSEREQQGMEEREGPVEGGGWFRRAGVCLWREGGRFESEGRLRGYAGVTQQLIISEFPPCDGRAR